MAKIRLTSNEPSWILWSLTITTIRNISSQYNKENFFKEIFYDNMTRKFFLRYSAETDFKTSSTKNIKFFYTVFE